MKQQVATRAHNWKTVFTPFASFKGRESVSGVRDVWGCAHMQNEKQSLCGTADRHIRTHLLSWLV